MLQHHRLTRLFSLLLLCSILLSMLPGNLLVHGVNEISSVEITGVTAPVSGATPDYSISVPGSAQYTIEQIVWTRQDNGSTMSASDTFESGKTYQISIVVKAGSNAVFTLDEIGYHMVVASIDGQSAVCDPVSGKNAAEYIHIKYQYTAKDSSGSQIRRVIVSGLNVPIPGSAPDYAATAGETSYSVSEIVWTHLNYAANTTSVTMTASSRFVPGGKYRVQVILKAAEGYAFSAATSGTLNGTAVSCQSVANQDASQYISLVYEYELAGGNQITHADVTGLTNPIKGARPDMSVTVSGSAQYTVSSVEWKYWKNTEDSTAAVSMSSQATFQTGYSYQVTVILKAKTGTSFATDSSGAPLVTGTINGEAALPGAAVVGKNATQYVGISYIYTLESTLVDVVAVTGIIDPIVNSRPNIISSIPKDKPYTVSEITWELFDDTFPPGEFTKMNAYSIFVSGIRYRINVTLKAAEGAEFATDETGKPLVTATINDYAAQAVESIPGKDPAQYICVRYEYPILTENIFEVEVFNVKEPVVGEKPDDEAEAPEDALYLVEKVTWERRDTSISPAKYVKMSDSEKFEANQDYRVTFLLKAKEGGTFYVNDYDMLQVTAQVNGKATIPAEAVKDKAPTEYVTIGYDFSLASDAKLIKRAPIYNLDVPQEGQVPDFEVSSDALAKFTIEKPVWERLANRQSSAAVAVLGEDDVFEQGHFYRVTITLKANEGAAFQTNEMGRPQVTITLNNGAGIAADRVVGKSSEEYICVSFVFGVYTAIDGGGAEWTPGKNPLKFRFTGDFKNFTEVRVNGTALKSDLYSASEGSTIIVLSKDYLDTLPGGTYELTVVYTDGQASTQFIIHDKNSSGRENNKGISPWVWLLPPLLLVLGILFIIVFILKRRAEARVYREEYEEYDEDDE